MSTGRAPAMRQQLDYLRADLRRFSLRERLSEPVVAAQVVYRLGRGALGLPAPLRQLASVLYGFAHLWAKVVSAGVDVPRTCEIGPGLRLFHCGPIIISRLATFGAHTTIAHGVTVGPLTEDGSGAPSLGDRCVLNPYSQVLGDLEIGDDVEVGALSVVLTDLPSSSTAVGSPARVLDGRPSKTIR